MDDEGDVDEGLGSSGVARSSSAVERLMVDCLRRGAVGLEREEQVQADPRHVRHVERQADGEPLVDEPIAKG